MLNKPSVYKAAGRFRGAECGGHPGAMDQCPLSGV